MKKALLVLFVFACGCAVGWRRPILVNPVHAQVSSPAYTCDFGPSGTTSAFPCAQYLIAIAPQRLGGGVMIWQVQSNPFAVNGATNLAPVGSGALSGASVQVLVPNSSTNTFTLSESQP